MLFTGSLILHGLWCKAVKGMVINKNDSQKRKVFNEIKRYLLVGFTFSVLKATHTRKHYFKNEKEVKEISFK